MKISETEIFQPLFKIIQIITVFQTLNKMNQKINSETLLTPFPKISILK
jgi:hypothetical protein